jgi:hypothetical protein
MHYWTMAKIGSKFSVFVFLFNKFVKNMLERKSEMVSRPFFSTSLHQTYVMPETSPVTSQIHSSQNADETTVKAASVVAEEILASAPAADVLDLAGDTQKLDTQNEAIVSVESIVSIDDSAKPQEFVATSEEQKIAEETVICAATTAVTTEAPQEEVKADTAATLSVPTEEPSDEAGCTEDAGVKHEAVSEEEPAKLAKTEE